MRGLSHSDTRERKAARAIEEYRTAVGGVACLDRNAKVSNKVEKEITALYYQGYDLDSLYIKNGEICVDEYV